LHFARNLYVPLSADSTLPINQKCVKKIVTAFRYWQVLSYFEKKAQTATNSNPYRAYSSTLSYNLSRKNGEQHCHDEEEAQRRERQRSRGTFKSFFAYEFNVLNNNFPSSFDAYYCWWSSFKCCHH